jgi:hypothetical protein
MERKNLTSSPNESGDFNPFPTGLRSGSSELRFTVHRPPTGEVSPCSHRPSGGDVACSVDVGVAPPGIAGFALENRLALPVSGGDVPARATGQPLLQRLQPLGLTRRETRRVKQLAGRQCGGYGNTAVDANHAAVTGAGDRVGNMCERDMPAASPITSNPVGLHTHRHRTRQAKPHPPNLRHPDPTRAPVQRFDLMRLHSDLPKPFMHTGFAPLRLAMCVIEEALHGLGGIPQRLLLHRLTSGPKPPVFGACLRQLPALLQVAGSLTVALPVLLLLHRQIPHIPRIPAVRQQCLLLLRSRQQSKPRHSRTVTTTTDIRRRSTPTRVGIGIRPGLKSKASNKRRSI